MGNEDTLQRVKTALIQTESREFLTVQCSSNCAFPKGDLAKQVVCDFCEVVYHISCVGLEKVPTKGAKTKWFCQPCLKLPGELHATQQQLQEALKIMAELSSLNTHTQLNLDDEDNLAHNKVTEDSYAKIAQNNVPTVPRKRQVLIIGDSLLRDVRGEDFDHNVNVNCIRGATLKDIKAVLVHGPNNLQASSHVLIHVGTNDVANNAASNIDILSEYEDLITSCQVRFGEQSPKFYISGPCPRGDQHSQSVKELNSQLKELSSKLDCGFLDNLKSFQYGDGEIDSTLFTSDGAHLSRKGTQKLREKFTTIGPICLRPQPRQHTRLGPNWVLIGLPIGPKLGCKIGPQQVLSASPNVDPIGLTN
ncbi:hypothetical protein HOLleu_40476 [Holothuria leucospilota]|uniref:PHD-type domain-containing protein n=1 Tax=Holothuria leucospilota TaxID=206669 RepID=A0A9Q1BDM5_HOLLE|nr:hypothetical protein HOLleu_40476 [Holothuria leucospilota]